MGRVFVELDLRERRPLGELGAADFWASRKRSRLEKYCHEYIGSANNAFRVRFKATVVAKSVHY